MSNSERRLILLFSQTQKEPVAGLGALTLTVSICEGREFEKRLPGTN